MKYNIPDTYLGEYIEYQRLFLLGSTGRAAIGSGTFISSTSSTSYPYTDGNDLFSQLTTVLANYLVTASDWNTLKNSFHTGSYAVTTNSGNDYSISFSDPYTLYEAGLVFRIKINSTNTGSATLNVDSLGAKALKKNINEDLVSGDLIVNKIYIFNYDGTNFQLLNDNVDALTQTISLGGLIY